MFKTKNFGVKRVTFDLLISLIWLSWDEEKFLPISNFKSKFKNKRGRVFSRTKKPGKIQKIT